MNVYERIRQRVNPQTRSRVKLQMLDIMNDSYDKLSLAKATASVYHHDQLYSGNLPYFVHLQEVYDVSLEFGCTQNVSIASYLHDILEDTDYTFDDLWRVFGWQIAMLVFLVTDEAGKNRKERKENTYNKTASNLEAVQLKLCDRIANVRNCIKTNNLKLFEMYVSEHDDIVKMASIYLDNQPILNMISHLDSIINI